MHLEVVRLTQGDQVGDALGAEARVGSMVQVVVMTSADEAFLGHSGGLPAEARIHPERGRKVLVVVIMPSRCNCCSKVVVFVVVSTKSKKVALSVTTALAE
ncbi:MAG TPA: hypothetical protein VGC32_02500 [Solirubrobacterales bacterium]